MNKLKILKTLPIIILLFACNMPQENVPTEISSPTDTPVIDEPVLTPTDEVSYVAIVNDEGISEELFLANLFQFEQALAEGSTNFLDGQTANEIVLNDLIDRLLLSQAARKAGFPADLDSILERKNQLVEQLGGEDALNKWIQENGYTDLTFQEALGLEMEAGWQRDQISQTVPTVTEQVKARQLFFFNNYEAESAYALLAGGHSFSSVVADYDPENFGYLDWFPRNYLLLPEIENLAFSLQLGEYSEIIETEFGYHILEVLDYDPARVLSGDALLTLQIKALQDWLDVERSQSQIEVLIPDF